MRFHIHLQFGKGRTQGARKEQRGACQIALLLHLGAQPAHPRRLICANCNVQAHHLMAGRAACATFAAAARAGKTRIAVAQMTAGADVASNMAVCSSLVAEAASLGVKLLFLPECFHYIGRGDGGGADVAEPLDGPSIAAYAAMAREHGVWLSLGGFPERVEPEDGAIAEEAAGMPGATRIATSAVADASPPACRAGAAAAAQSGCGVAPETSSSLTASTSTQAAGSGVADAPSSSSSSSSSGVSAPTPPATRRRGCNTHVVLSSSGRVCCAYRKASSLPAVRLCGWGEQTVQAARQAARGDRG